jgi:hypothetical protein
MRVAPLEQSSPASSAAVSRAEYALFCPVESPRAKSEEGWATPGYTPHDVPGSPHVIGRSMNPSGGLSAFISYASEDGEKAHDICRNLEKRGATCWIAPRNVRVGREYADEIVTGIERSACMIVLLSSAANKSPFVCREVERAIANHKPIFPIRIEAVMPDAGLELFISATHWLDVWDGDWDDHMQRLAQGITELTAGVSAQPARPTRERRRSFRVAYAAALVLAIATGGFGMWTFFPGRSRTPPSDTDVPSAARPPSELVVPPSPQVEGGTRSSAAVDARSELPVAVEAGSGSAATRDARSRRTQNEQGSAGSTNSSSSIQVAVPPRGQPPGQRTAVPGPAAVQRGSDLNKLRDEYDDLSIRGDVIDDTLNRFWEEMRPLAPRQDIATRQRSLKVSLTGARDAIDHSDAVAARKYLDTARADAVALDEFLGR